MSATDVIVGDPAGSRRTSALVALLRRDGLLFAVVAVYAAFMSLQIPGYVNQDTWFALAGGREIIHHGFSGTDHLAYWTAGEHWVDQPWLSQALIYLAVSIGGLKLLAVLSIALVSGTLALVLWGARRLGASPRAAAATLAAMFPVLWGNVFQLRTQTLVFPLLACLLVLLLEDARAPSRRVFLVLPILALWANLHGSVVLAATLVVARAGLLLLSRGGSGSRRLKGLLLGIGAPIACAITPWGLDIVHYYRETLLNPAFKSHIVEWQAPSLSAVSSPLYIAAGLILWLLGRYHREFRVVERVLLLLLLGFAFWSIRNVVWLGLGAPPLVAPGINAIFERRAAATPSTNLRIGLASGALAFIALLFLVTRPASWLTRDFPAPVAAAVARATSADPRLKVYANERYADWLLFTQPALRGRIAFDIRFELLSKRQLDVLGNFRAQATAHWRSAIKDAQLLVLFPHNESNVEKQLLRDGGYTRIYRDHLASVLLRSPAKR
jgi:hypothetical protein